MADEKIKVRRTFIAVVLIILLFLGAVLTAVLLTVSRPQNITVKLLIGGSEITKEIKQGDYIERPNPQEIEVQQGFSFDNWYQDEAYTVPYDFSNPINKNTNIYGRLIRNKYQAEFKYNYTGSGILPSDSFKSLTGDFGVDFQIPTDTPLRTNYQFIGYTRTELPEQGSYFYSLGEWVNMPLSGITFYAQYRGEAKSVTINYQDARKNGQIINETEFTAYFSEDFVVPDTTGIHHKDYTKVFLGYTIAGGDGTVYAGGSIIDKEIINGLPLAITLNEEWGNPSGEVTLNWNLSSLGGPYVSLQFVEGYVFTLPTAESDGVNYPHYDFAGWIRDDDFNTVYTSTYVMPGTAVQLNALWERKQYTVTYNGNGSTSGITQYETRAYDTLVTVKPSIFSKTNYTFTGWNTEPDGLGTSYAEGSTFNISSSFTLYAQWEGNLKTVKFKDLYLLESGYMADIRFDTVQVNFGNYFILPSNLNLSNDLLRTLSNSDYNKWFDGVYIEGYPSVIYGASRQHDEPGKTYSSATQIEITGDLSLYLNFAVSGNRLRFVANADDPTWAPADYTYVTGYLTYAPISIPYRNGYNFHGWSTASDGTGTVYAPGASLTMPEGLNSFYAKWQGQERTLIYNGGLGGTLVGDSTKGFITHYDATYWLTGESESVYEGDTITIVNISFEKDGWHQIGWNTKADGTGRDYALFDTLNPNNPDSKIDITEYGDITLWAVYAENALTFSFEGGLGNVTGSVANVSAAYQQFSYLPNNGFSRQNYVFAGWSENINAVVGSSEVFAEGFGYFATSDKAFYAIWTGSLMTVYYNANKEGTTGVIGPSIGYYNGSLVIENGSGFTNPNFDFVGWNTQTDGLGDSYVAGTLNNIQFTSDFTLYAVWAPKAKTVTYIANDGTSTEITITNHGGGGSTIRYGDQYEVEGMSFVNSGYIFAGWNDRSTGLGNSCAIGSTLLITGNMTLYAMWTPAIRTITIDLSDVASLSGLLINGDPITLEQQSSQEFVDYVANNGSIVLPNLTHTGGPIFSLTSQLYAGFEVVAGDIVGNIYINGGTIAGVTGDIELILSWTNTGVTRVDFDSNGGTPGYSSIPQGSLTPSGPDFLVDLPVLEPTREGFSFLGWSSDGGTTLYNAGETGILVIGGSITAYVAQWQAETRNIIFNLGAGTTGSVSNIMGSYYSDIITLPNGAGLTRIGYTFVGWGFSDFVSGGIVDLDAFGVDNAKVYGLALQALLGVGSPNHAINIWGNGSFTTINSIFDAGTDFLVLDNGLSSSDTYIYAVWLPDTVTIRIEGNGGATSGGLGYVEYQVVFDGSLSINNVFNVPSQYYTFWGIADNADGALGANLNGTSVSPKTAGLTITGGVIKLYARWTPKTLTVHYSDILDTNVDLETTAAYGSNYTLLDIAGVEALDLSYLGIYDARLVLYDFAGWKMAVQPFAVYQDGYIINGLGPDTAGSFEVWFYATWTGKAITITYSDNDASPSTRTVSGNYGENYTFEGQGAFTVPSSLGNGTFRGWSLVSSYQEGIDLLFEAGSEARLDETLSPTIMSGVTFYAVWAAEQIIITYNMNGASSPNIQIIVDYDGDHSIIAFIPIRTGYVFKGWTNNSSYKDAVFALIPSQYWFIDDGNTSTYELTNLTTNVTLYAVWAANDMSIVVYGSGGTFAHNNSDTLLMMCNYGSSLKFSDLIGNGCTMALTRTNYTLVGLIDGSGTSYDINTAFIVTSSMSFTAVWSANEIHITYHGEGGKTGQPLGEIWVGTLFAGQSVTLLDFGFTREGFELIGWSYTSGGPVDKALNSTFTPGGDMDLYAVWQGEEKTITYYSNNGSGQFYEANGTAGATYIVKDIDDAYLGWTRTGHTFVGWVTAQYANATDWASIPSTNKFEAYDTFTITDGILLYAYWTPNLYNITFAIGQYDADGYEILGNTSGTMNNGGAGYSQYYGYGFIIPANGFSGDFVEFDYYSLNSNGSGVKYYSGQTLTISGSTTVYAIMKYKTITIIFNGNGSDGGTAPISMVVPINGAGASYVFPANTFTKTNYTFNGWWYQTSKGSAGISAGGGVSHAMWLDSGVYRLTATALELSWNFPSVSAVLIAGGYSWYALWELNTTTITLNPNNGVMPAETPEVLTVTQNQNYNLPDNSDLTTPFTPSQTYFRFAFWSTSASDDPTGSAGLGVSRYFTGDPIAVGTSAIQLYAIWIQDTFTITFKSNGGGAADIVWTFNKRADAYTDIDTNSMSYGFYYPNAYRYGFTFYGWHTQQNWDIDMDFDGTLSSLSGFVGNSVSRYLIMLETVLTGQYVQGAGHASGDNIYIPGDSSDITYYAIWITQARVATIELYKVSWGGPWSVHSTIVVPVGLTEFTFLDVVAFYGYYEVWNHGSDIEIYDDILSNATVSSMTKTLMDFKQLTGINLSSLAGDVASAPTAKDKLMVYDSYLNLGLLSTDTPQEMFYKINAVYIEEWFDLYYVLLGGYTDGGPEAWFEGETVDYTFGGTFNTLTTPQFNPILTAETRKYHTTMRQTNFTIVYNSNKPVAATWAVVGSMPNSNHKYADPLVDTISANAYSLPGYIFKGWTRVQYKDTLWGSIANNANSRLEDEASVADITHYGPQYVSGHGASSGQFINGATFTLYAVWEQTDYTVTLDPNTGAVGAYSGWTLGSGILTKDLRYYTIYNAAGFAPYNNNGVTKTGYNFLGWYTQALGGTQIFDTTGKLNPNINILGDQYSDASYRWLKASNITLYAQWAAGNFTLNLDYGDGNLNNAGSYHTYEFGEYPKTYVGDSLNAQLETSYNGGTLQNGMTLTGKTYSANSITGSTDIYIEKLNKEYRFNGQRYVRVSSIKYSSGDQYAFSDGTAMGVTGTYYWFKVEPIKWIIANYDDLPTSINPLGSGTATTIILVAEDTIMSGIPFYPNNADTDITMWQNSIIRGWLNGIDTSSVNPVGAPAAQDFTSQGSFMNDAFSSTEQSRIQLTTSLVNNGQNAAGGPDTNDYIYLLNYADVTSVSSQYYSIFNSNASRRNASTDFAKSHNAYVYGTLGADYGYGYYWLRSAYSSTGVSFVGSTGSAFMNYFNPYGLYYGIRPALNISIVGIGDITGNSTTSKTVTYDSAVGTLPTPSRAGYSFEGWYKESDFITEVTDLTVYNNNNFNTDGNLNSTIYARWNNSQYTLTLNADGGSGVSPTVNYNITDAQVSVGTPTKEGYTFDGWEVTAVTVAGNLSVGSPWSFVSGTTHGSYTLTAQWTANSGTLSFDYNDNSYYTIEYGEYPKTYVGDVLNAQLETAYNDGITLLNGMTLTGKTWSANSVTSGAYTEKLNKEYQLGGQRYVRVSSIRQNSGNQYAFSDGTTMNVTGTIYWFKVEPIKWIILNWAELPASINPNGSGIATTVELIVENTIMSGISFYPNSSDANRSMWQNLTIRGWLNGTNVNNLPTNGAPSGGNFTGKGFINDAFSPAEKLAIEDTTLANSDDIGTGYDSPTGAGSAYDTIDKIYCLSAYEITEQYSELFYNKMARINTSTDYAKAHYNSVGAEGGSYYFMRTASNNGTMTVFYVREDGSIGHGHNTYVGIRPAMQIALSAAGTVSNSSKITGGSTTSKSVIYDDPAGTLPNPSLTGYNFDGWYKTSALTNPAVTSSTTYNSTNFDLDANLDSTVYAKWTAIQYTLYRDLNGGSGIPSNGVQYYINSTSIPLGNPTRTGYTFNGWKITAKSGDGNLSVGQNWSFVYGVTYGSYTLQAQWTANTYIIILNPDGGTITAGGDWYYIGSQWQKAMTYDNAYVGSYHVPYDDLLGNGLSFIENSGYTFTGWWYEDLVNGDLLIFGPTGILQNDKAGFTANDNLKKWLHAGTVTLKAGWIANGYTLGYSYNGATGGDGASNQPVTYGQAVGTLPSPTREGYSFGGWFKEAGLVNQITSSTIYNSTNFNLDGSLNSTIYAKWTHIQYTLTIALNGGNGGPGASVNYYIDDLSVPLTEPTRDGYTFTGWKVTTVAVGVAGNLSFGSPWSFVSGTTHGSYTLTAQWTVNTLSISYASGGGSGSDPVSPTSQTYNGNVTMPANPYTRTGYTFTGWAVSGTGSIAGTYAVGVVKTVDELSSAILTGDAGITLTAVWAANSYILYFDDGTQWVSVVGGYDNTHAIDTAGNLWAWGTNNYGQLGDGTTTDRLSPVKITNSDGTQWVSVHGSRQRHTLAIDTAGNLWAWGLNSQGQLGDGTTTDRHSPVKITNSDNTQWVFGDGGARNSFAIDTAGNLWSWGYNNYGQLGDGTITDRLSPVKITNSDGTQWVSIAGGFNNAFAIDTADNLWAWGRNNCGQLGDGTTTDRHSPVKITNSDNTQWVLVSTAGNANGDHTLAIDTAGNLWSWGYNNYGQLGDGTTTDRLSPVKITNSDNTQWVSIGASSYHSLSIDTAGNLWAWGANYYGRLGDGTTTDRHSPVKITNSDNTQWVSIDRGQSYSLAIDTAGNLWAWGLNTSGQLGDGTTVDGSTDPAKRMPNKVMHNKTVTYDSAVGTLITPTRTGYIFGGWYKEIGLSTQVTDLTVYNNTNLTLDANGNSIVYAKWTPVQYALTINLDGGSGGPSSPTTYYIDDLSVSLAAPTKTGYTFTGWKVTAVTVAGNLFVNDPWNFISGKTHGSYTLTAQWTVQQYNITYLDVGGSAFSGTHVGVTPVTHTYGTPTTLGSASKTYFSFDGWFTASNGGGSAISSLGATDFTSDITLYAKWTQISTEVTFNTQISTMTISSDPNWTVGSFAWIATKTINMGTDLSAIQQVPYMVLDSFGWGTPTSASKVGIDNSSGGWMLTGWSTIPGGVQIFNGDGSIIPNVAGYTDASGRWIYAGATLTLSANPGQAVNWRVYLDADGGTLDSSFMSSNSWIIDNTSAAPYNGKYYRTFTMSSNAPVMPTNTEIANSGYTFGGWNVSVKPTVGNLNVDAPWTYTKGTTYGNYLLQAQWSEMLGSVNFAPQTYQESDGTTMQMPSTINFTYNASGNNVTIPNNVTAGSGYRRMQTQTILTNAAGNNGGSGTNQSFQAYSDVMYYSLTPYASYAAAIADKANWIDKTSLYTGASKPILTLFPDFWTTKGGTVTLYPIWRDYLQPIATAADFDVYLVQHLDNLGDEYALNTTNGGKFIYYQTANMTLFSKMTINFYGKYYGQGYTLGTNQTWIFDYVSSTTSIINGCVFSYTVTDGWSPIRNPNYTTITYNTSGVVFNGSGTVGNNSYLGGLFGKTVSGMSTLSYNIFNGTINLPSGYSLTSVGGIIGYSSHQVYMMDNIFSGTINLSGSASATYIGGILGFGDVQQIDTTYTGNKSTGSILWGTALSKGTTLVTNTYVGGVLGYQSATLLTDFNNDFSGTIEIYNSSSTGNLYVGGSLGYAYGSTVVIKGNITPNMIVDAETGDNLYVGGVAAYLTTNAKISAGTLGGSIYVKRPSKTSYVGGVIGYITNTITVSAGIENNTAITFESDVLISGSAGSYAIGGVVGHLLSNINAINNADIYSTGNTSISGSAMGIGGIAGTAGNVVVQGVNKGDIYSDLSEGILGGIVGKATAAAITIQDSYNAGDITGLNVVSGILANLYNSSFTISRVENRGNLTSSGYIGGIAGVRYGGNGNPTSVIEYAQNSGTIYGSGAYTVGGIMAGTGGGSAQYAEILTIREAVNLGEIIGVSGQRKGGILGQAYYGTLNLSNVINCFNMPVGTGNIVGHVIASTNTINTNNVYHLSGGADSIAGSYFAGNIAGAPISAGQMQIDRTLGSIYQYFGTDAGIDGIYGTGDDILTEDYGPDGIYGTEDDVCVWDFNVGENPRLWFDFTPQMEYDIRYDPVMGYHTASFGKYPKTFVGTDTTKPVYNALLESCITGGSINANGVIAGLTETGKTYSANSVTAASGYTEKLNKEYKLNGKRYVRVASIPNYTAYVFSDGTVIGATGTIHWFKVEPIKWIIMNWDRLPVTINPSGDSTATTIEFYAEDLIIANIPFYPNNADTNGTMWQNSTIRGWLNGTNVNNLPTNGAPNGGDFTGKGFINEAFGSSSKLAIADTTLANTDNIGTGYDSPTGAGSAYDTTDKIYLPSRYEMFNNYSTWRWLFGSSASRQKEPTDYAKSNKASVNSIGGNVSGTYWMRSAKSSSSVHFVNYTGNIPAFDHTPSTLSDSIRPAMNVKFRWGAGANGIHLSPNGYHTIEYGEYPQSYAGSAINNVLVGYVQQGPAYGGGGNKNVEDATVTPTGTAAGLVKTGKYFTDPYNDEKLYVYTFNEQEYVLKWNCGQWLIVFDNGEVPNALPNTWSEQIVWIKVEPLKWIITNWNELPTNINPEGAGTADKMQLVAERGIFGGIMFQQDDTYPASWGDMWQNSIVRGYLNGFDMSNVNGNSSTFLQMPMPDFSGAGLYDEAFSSLERERINYSQISNTYYGVVTAGYETYDYLYLPSADEFTSWVPWVWAQNTYPTDFALLQGAQQERLEMTGFLLVAVYENYNQPLTQLEQQQLEAKLAQINAMSFSGIGVTVFRNNTGLGEITVSGLGFGLFNIGDLETFFTGMTFGQFLDLFDIFYMMGYGSAQVFDTYYCYRPAMQINL
ncbi:MAG: InlB B-repeat-containing protein [Christensenellaceae bacterium]|nr:InlB B-repeat-containing protein [Christensenellaceae bacterium]